MKKQEVNSPRFEPLGDHVLVVPAPAKAEIGGLYIPEAHRKNPPFGTVVAVGPGKEQHEANENMMVKKGDTVMYGEYAGTPVSIDGRDYLLFRQSDFLGKLVSKDVQADIKPWGKNLNPEGKLDPNKGIHETYNPAEAGQVTSLESTIGADVNAKVTSTGIITSSK